MKKFTAAALGVSLAFGFVFPAFAQTSTETSPASSSSGGSLTGKVDSTEKPKVTVQFPENQTQTYALEPGLVTSMNLSQGSTVTFGKRKLGTIVNVSRYSVVVQFADGESESYLLTQEGRATLTFGDRVVVTPNLQLARADSYTLTAADIQDPIFTSASSTVTPNNSTNQPMPDTTSPATTPSTPSDPTMTAPSTSDPTMPQTPKTPAEPTTPGTIMKP